MNWQLNGVRIVPAGDLDPNTPQTPGMTRAADMCYILANASSAWSIRRVTHDSLDTAYFFFHSI